MSTKEYRGLCCTLPWP